jgi:copper chaperone CopZ
MNMSDYIHHVPGRMRIKSPFIKRNEAGAKAVLRLLQAMDGIVSAEANPVTGSVIINYDKNGLDPAVVLTALRAHGYIDAAGTVASDGSSAVHRAASKVGEALGKAVFGALVDKAIERSAMALVGALI